MTNLSSINVQQSIEKRRLICKRSWLEIVDKVAFSFVCVALVTAAILTYFELNINSPNERVIAFFFVPVANLFGLYGLYRKLCENRLMKVETSFSQDINKRLALAFIRQEGYRILKQNQQIIIANAEEVFSINKLWTRTVTLIISDSAIYFNMAKNYPRANPPVFFSHLLFLGDLKKLVKRCEKNALSLKDASPLGSCPHEPQPGRA